MSVWHTHSQAKGVRGKFKYEVEAHSQSSRGYEGDVTSVRHTQSSKRCEGEVTSVRHTHSQAKGVRGKLRV